MGTGLRAIVLMLMGVLALGLGPVGWAAFEGAHIWPILIEVRLPMVVGAMAAGASLGAGAWGVQALARTPIADSQSLGLGSVATAMGALGFATGMGGLGTALMALGGVGLSAGVLFAWAKDAKGRGPWLGQAVESSQHDLLQAGIVLNLIGAGLLGLVLGLSSDPWSLARLSDWLLGRIDQIDGPLALGLCAISMISWRMLAKIRVPLEIMMLSPQRAISLGISDARMRWMVVMAVAFGAGVATAFVGLLGFVGIAAMVTARKFSSPHVSYARLLEPACLAGAGWVLAAHAISYGLAARANIKPSIAITMLAGPLLAIWWIAQRRSVSQRRSVPSGPSSASDLRESISMINSSQSMPHPNQPTKNSSNVGANMLEVEHLDINNGWMRLSAWGLEKGMFVCLMGPNGAGKTSFLDVLACAGKDIVVRRGSVAYMPQSLGAGVHAWGGQAISCDRVLDHMVDPWGKEPLGRHAARIRLPASWMDQPWSHRSGGERSLLLVQGLLASSADILLLDEPTAGMDKRNTEEVFKALAQAARSGRAICMATHEVALAHVWADGWIQVDGGNIAPLETRTSRNTQECKNS